METRVEPRLLKGFRDFLPEEQARRSAMLATIVRAFETCGFSPLSTPAIEYADILLGKYGDEGDKLLYRFQDNGGRDVALRYDLTVPLARVMAQYRDLPKPFRRYQVGTVWRAEKPAHGRFREFTQCDADIVGTGSWLADADCVAAVVLALKWLGVERFAVRLGHRAVLNGVLRNALIMDPAAQIEALRAVDKLDKIGWEAVAEILAGISGVGPESARILREYLESDGMIDFGVEGLVSGFQDQPDATDGFKHLKGVLLALKRMGYGEHVKVDLTIARGLDYYTGTVFETTLLDLPGIGSIASGGRYDGLLTMFDVRAIPAVGISIGVDRLFAALTELNQIPGAHAGPVAVVCLLGESVMEKGLALLAAIRAANVSSEVVSDYRWKPGKQIEFAAKRGARFAVLVGEAEVASGTAAVKDLADGTQESIDLGRVPGVLAGRARG
jgi:histidyl-tRNA synthetase